MMIPQIHDRLFRNVFSDRREAAALLRPHLPRPLADGLNWSTLTLLNRTYIDDDARTSELDLLFTIERGTDEEPLALYVLLEHQSEPNRYMRLRLLKYCCRIWEQAEQEAGRRSCRRPSNGYRMCRKTGGGRFTTPRRGLHALLRPRPRLSPQAGEKRNGGVAGQRRTCSTCKFLGFGTPLRFACRRTARPCR